MATDARETALLLLNTLEQKPRPLDDLFEQVYAQHPQMPRRDRSFLNALVYGVLRWRGQLDWIAAHFSKRPLEKIDPGVLNIIRLGLFQIVHLSRIPVSAAVNTSVEMVKRSGKPWVGGFVNAMLRAAAAGFASVPFPDERIDPIGALAAGKSFPAWLIERWSRRYGVAETGALCDALNRIPPITLRTNTLKTSRENLIGALSSEFAEIEATPQAPDGIWACNPRRSIPELEAFQQGWFQVQDEAAQLVSLLLQPRAGHRVLDACAGLGGKTGHLAQLMENRGSITALDRNAHKLGRLEREMQRLGITIVQTCANDLEQETGLNDLGCFDRILVDAPCSGLGVLRRNPDTRWAASKKNLSPYRERQGHILDRLTGLLKPGGVLVYAVCSMEPEESEQVAEAFVERNPGFTHEKFDPPAAQADAGLIDPRGYLRTVTHRHNMDGFFAARFRRVG